MLAAAAATTGALAGCASIGSDAIHQGALARSEPEGATIYVEGKAAARTPAFVSIHRSRQPFYELETASGRERVPLTPHYRWGRSFFGNLAFWTGAPLGWLFDFATGAAWDADDAQPAPVRLSKADAQASLASPADSAFPLAAIAPPSSDLLDLSDFAGHEIERALATGAYSFRPRPYAETLPEFVSRGYDFDGAPGDPREIYAKMGARYLIESKIETQGESAVVSAKPRDTVTGELGKPFELPLEAAGAWSRGYSAKQWWARLAPNTLGLGLISEAIDISAGGHDYGLTQVDSDQWWDQGLRYISAIEVSNVPPRREGRGLRGVFAFVPAARLSRLEAHTSAFVAPDGSTDQSFLRLRASGGYGAEAGAQLGQHYLYLNVTPLFYWSQLSWMSYGQNRSITTTGVQTQVEVGYAVFFSRSWLMRAFTRTQPEDSAAWSEALSDRLPASQAQGFSVTETTVGVSLAYRFEPRFTARRARPAELLAASGPGPQAASSE